jgi:nitrogen fixation/metabolism regulation signal transduction histidine kinase
VPQQRKRIWIDRFQTFLFLRIALYFVCYQIVIWAFVTLERDIFAGLEQMLGGIATAYGYVFLPLTVVVVSLLFILDAIRFAHRMVGPLRRFRKSIAGITAGEEQVVITLRKDDFLQEMKDEFNEMLAALERRGAVVMKTTEAKKEQGQPVSA